ncbi:hypothetical protein SK128_016402, partial [Halocaridina rubra]
GKFAAVRRARHRATGQVFAAKYVRRRRRNVSLECEARHEVAVLLLGLRDPHIKRAITQSRQLLLLRISVSRPKEKNTRRLCYVVSELALSLWAFHIMPRHELAGE